MWKYNVSKHSVEERPTWTEADFVNKIPVQGKVDWKDGEDVTGKFTIGNGHFSIYSKPGTKVTTDTLHIGFGYESDKEKAMQYLTPKAIYIIDRINVYDFNTTVYLKEFENIGFNSVHFISPEIVAIPINIQEQPQVLNTDIVAQSFKHEVEAKGNPNKYPVSAFSFRQGAMWLKKINQSQEQPIESDLIIAGLEEGSEMWKAEYDNCRKILEHLVQLKEWKDTNTNMDIYNVQKPLAWQYAKKFLEKYQHQ